MPTSPNGTDTKNTSRQSQADSTPPRINPMNEPAMAATWLMPSAMPRRLAGKASTRIAVEFANSIDPPTPWTNRQRISHSAPALPLNGSRASAMEPMVKTTKPAL